jgi:hypothetical protein
MLIFSIVRLILELTLRHFLQVSSLDFAGDGAGDRVDESHAAFQLVVHCHVVPDVVEHLWMERNSRLLEDCQCGEEIISLVRSVVIFRKD